MATTRLQCKLCGSTFTLRAQSLEAVASKPFKCPKCGYSTSLGQLMRPGGGRGAGNLHTHIGGAPGMAAGNHTPTRIAGSADKVIFEVAELKKAFRLGAGSYTIGRDSDDSQATLKLAPDRYMSRLQAQLNIQPIMNQKLPLIVRIKNLSPTNPIYVNNEMLDAGKSATLKNGDNLLIGMTKVVVKM